MEAACPVNDAAKGGKATATCNVCPHLCRLSEGELGMCRARRCVDGRVVDDNYGRVTSLALDPIEKKPLARFMAGSKVLSVGSYGCNLSCGFCQNASIACASADDVAWREVPPRDLVRLAQETAAQGNVGIAFTYNEPLVGYEYVRDCARLAHDAGLVNVLVSNGMANPAPVGELLPLIDAANIDLKGFTQAFYDMVDGSLECVKRTIEAFARAEGCHLEVTTLVVPGLNDDPADIDAAARWLASLDAGIVYHLTRFFPCHRFVGRQPTPVEDVYRLADVARRHLPHVLVGNC